MSAIAGIVGAKGRPSAETAIRSMLAAMAHRAPDGAAIRKAQGGVLGHGAMRTLAEDEPQPVAEGGLSITADVRLDNRPDLLAALAIADTSVSDARLILRAYRQWGEDCAARLLGDFAFAIWDEAEQRLFAARDFVGVKPFYYHPDEARFVFASEIKALFAEGSTSRHVDEVRLAEFLAAVPPPADQTIYRGVLRLPAAHSLVLAKGGVRLKRYWSPPDGPSQARKDAPALFASLLRTAVEARLRGVDAPGALLSGGLDSSALACLAAPLVKTQYGAPLKTVSVVFDKTPGLNERPQIETVLRNGDFDPSFMDGHGVSAFARFPALMDAQDAPFLSPNLDLTTEVYRACAQRGLKVVLNGHGGDEVVSQGYGRLHELAKAGRWAALWREAKGAADIFGQPVLPTFMGYVERHGPGGPLFHLWRRLQRKMGAPAAGPAPGWDSILNPDFIARTGVREIRGEVLAPARRAESQREHHLAMTDPRMQSYAMEILDRAAASAGVEGRHPFWDRRLFEFCLTLPSEEILDGGWTRLILRRAMQGVLPKEIQWRRDKMDFTPHLAADMVGPQQALIEDILVADRADIGGYVDLGGARAAWSRMLQRQSAATGYDVQFVWRVVAFGLWLERETSLPGGLSGA